MATKKKSGGSVVSLTKTKAALRKKIALQNKKKKDVVRVAKLRREVTALKNKLKTATKTARKK